ncbi:MAG: hypothetical protein ACFFED_18605 [Candidatus Thorarchaeota archaeon]
MVVRMVARVELDTMASKPLYPPEVTSEQRVALLTGIVQLVQTALQSDGVDSAQGVSHYMKSDKGVVGYMQCNDNLFICEADNEKEAGVVLDIILERSREKDENIVKLLEKALRKRGRELSSLWG